MDFWNSTAADDLQDAQMVKMVLTITDPDPKAQYELLFYSSFATKILHVMRREGKDAPGFDRMQQSFTEAVTKVRDVLSIVVSKGMDEVQPMLEMTAAGMTKLLVLMEDLSRYKDWQNAVTH